MGKTDNISNLSRIIMFVLICIFIVHNGYEVILYKHYNFINIVYIFLYLIFLLTHLSILFIDNKNNIVDIILIVTCIILSLLTLYSTYKLIYRLSVHFEFYQSHINLLIGKLLIRLVKFTLYIVYAFIVVCKHRKVNNNCNKINPPR